MLDEVTLEPMSFEMCFPCATVSPCRRLAQKVQIVEARGITLK